MIPFLTAPAGVQLLPGMHPVRPKCGPMLMGYTPVLPEWVLGVWGYRGGHSPWWGAPQHTTIWSGWYLGLYFPIGVYPHSCQINSESCMGWKAHKMKGCRGLNNIFTRLGVTSMTPMFPGCTPTGAAKKAVYKLVNLSASFSSIV